LTFLLSEEAAEEEGMMTMDGLVREEERWEDEI
jgi:hypothetical protein